MPRRGYFVARHEVPKQFLDTSIRFYDKVNVIPMSFRTTKGPHGLDPESSRVA